MPTPSRVKVSCPPHALIGLLWIVVFHSQLAAQQITGFDTQRNSSEIVRVQPSQIAERIGSAVNWRPTLLDALKESHESGKPVFWYVPTLDNSFMDRKVELDRYMKAGYFSWPQIIESLNEHFIPVRAVPNQRWQQKLELVPFRFVEPGFVILNANREMIDQVDRINTQHPGWMLDRLAKQFAFRAEPPAASRLHDVWEQFSRRDYAGVLETLRASGEDATLATEKNLLIGMAHYRMGRRDQAKAAWQRAATLQPDHPLAWKAAAEAEGFGPFCRGFEVHVELPDRATADQPRLPDEQQAPVFPTDLYTEADLWRRGVEFLLGMQADDGGYHDCDYDFGGTDSLPNVHLAVTSIVSMALLKAKQHDEFVAEDVQRIDRAIERATSFVLDPKNLNLADSDERFWALAYRLRFISALVRQSPDGPRGEQLPGLVGQLENQQMKNGSWFHEYPNPFVTGLALLTLKEAASAGAAVNPQTIERGIQSLKHNRTPSGYPYFDRDTDETEPFSDNLAEASAGRLPMCELGLFVWDESTEDRLLSAISDSNARQSHLLATLKYDDHTSRYGYGGFFFWFDMHGRSDAIASLSQRFARMQCNRPLRELVLSLPEIDGCFVDSHELGRCYGTSMALLCLANAAEEK